MMEDEILGLREETKRLTRDMARIAREVGAASPDLESCLAAIRRIRQENLNVSKFSVPTFRTLYHITSRDNLLSIRQDGLKCSLGSRSHADGFAVPLIHCFEDKIDVEEAITGWVQDVLGLDGGFVILEFLSHGPATRSKTGPVLLEDVPFSAISVFDECFCPENLEPVEDQDGMIAVEEAVVWLNENGCSTHRDGGRINVDIHDDFTVIRVEDERVDMWSVNSAMRDRADREQSYDNNSALFRVG
jgi:hypothetical protein